MSALTFSQKPRLVRYKGLTLHVLKKTITTGKNVIQVPLAVELGKKPISIRLEAQLNGIKAQKRYQDIKTILDSPYPGLLEDDDLGSILVVATSFSLQETAETDKWVLQISFTEAMEKTLFSNALLENINTTIAGALELAEEMEALPKSREALSLFFPLLLPAGPLRDYAIQKTLPSLTKEEDKESLEHLSEAKTGQEGVEAFTSLLLKDPKKTRKQDEEKALVQKKNSFLEILTQQKKTLSHLVADSNYKADSPENKLRDYAKMLIRLSLFLRLSTLISTYSFVSIEEANALTLLYTENANALRADYQDLLFKTIEKTRLETLQSIKENAALLGSIKEQLVAEPTPLIVLCKRWQVTEEHLFHMNKIRNPLCVSGMIRYVPTQNNQT